MFTIKNLQKSIWPTTIFQDTNISLHRWQKVAIVWPNGSGKSTLAKIIAHIDTDVIMDSNYDNHLSIWYMHQTMNSIYDDYTIVDRFDNILWISKLQQSIMDLSVDYESHSALYDSQYELFEKLWWRNFTANIRNITNIFWLQDIELDRHIYTLSWWQKNKLLLCAAILWWTDLVILDEPSNNLDSQSIDLLIQYIYHSDKSFIIISHDPDFINKTSNTIREIRDQQIYTYTWNYDDYINSKDIEYQKQVMQYEQDLQDYKQLQKTSIQLSQKANTMNIRKNTRDNDAFDGYNKVAKKLDKTAAILRDKMSDIPKQKPNPPRSIKFDLSKIANKNWYIHINNLHFIYPDTNFNIQIDDLHISMWDKIYIRGSNGSGKSTIIKLITWVITPDSGSIYIHPNIRIWYFAQIDHLLSSDMKIIDYIYTFGNFELSDIVFNLKKLGLSDNDIHKTINALSPWLKSKLSLAILSLQKCNCIIFDEVTNHIDHQTTQQIQSAINWFDGVVIVVSHDQYFVSSINFDHKFVVIDWILGQDISII